MCYEPIVIMNMKTRVRQRVSCRKCLECMQTRANEWAVRGHFELKEHNQNTFITLTYEKSPIILVKKDLQNFIKRLRKKIDPIKIKYFSAGEYGDKGLRPHFHIIIFGYDFDDKVYLKQSQSDLPIYESKILNNLWDKGIAIIQDANVNTIRYSAKYSAKLKNDLPEALKNYPEFNTMSQNLGVKPILDRIEKFLPTNEIFVDGFGYRIPKIILYKYFREKVGRYEADEAVKDYQDKFFEYNTRSEQQLDTAKRLAFKKKMFAKLRYL